MALNCHSGMVKLQADFYGKDKEKDDFAVAMEPVELLSAGTEQNLIKPSPLPSPLKLE